MPDDPHLETIEREVKLSATVDFALPSLEGVVPGVTVGPAVERRLVADYYDTDDLRLTARGLSLRFRTGDGSGWMVKVPVDEGPGGLGGLVRREISLPGEAGPVPAAALDLLRPAIGDAAVDVVVRLVTVRRACDLVVAGDTVGEIDDDDVEVLDGDRPAGRFREIEVEVTPAAPPSLLQGVVDHLRRGGAGEPDPTPKVIRAVSMVRPTVRAAGGVVWRPGDGGPEVLVVHRPKYDDWSLPKGKRDEGETDEACALREVEEETGFRCSLGPELAGTRYVDNRGRPKVVRYWAMTVDDGAFTPGDEVDEVRWLPADAARSSLSYDHDRAVLDGFDPATG